MRATVDNETSPPQNEQGDAQKSLYSSEQDVVAVLSPQISNNNNKGATKGNRHSKTKNDKKSVKDKINQANENAKDAILDSYLKEEELRQNRQKPLMISIIILLALQLIAFNVLMFILVLNGAKTINVDIFEKLLEFLKYYIGAVVVELIGLIVTITANTFSSKLSKSVHSMYMKN